MESGVSMTSGKNSMLNSNKRLTSALEEMQKAGRSIKEEKKEGDSWW